MSKDKLKVLLKLAKTFDTYDIDNDPGILVLKCRSKTTIWPKDMPSWNFAKKFYAKTYDLSVSSLRLTSFEQKKKVSLSKLDLHVVIAKTSLTTLKSIKPDMTICVLALKFGIGRHILYMKLNVKTENHTNLQSCRRLWLPLAI